jgi:hypothetical protein
MPIRRRQPGLTPKEAKVLREVENLERRYGQAQAFDDAQKDKWLRRVSKVFTKRTDFPKLGYIIHRLNELGIPSALWGKSFHGPILRVHKDFVDEAWRVLDEPVVMGGRWRAGELDDIEDDDPVFYAYEKMRPDPDLWP